MEAWESWAQFIYSGAFGKGKFTNYGNWKIEHEERKAREEEIFTETVIT